MPSKTYLSLPVAPNEYDQVHESVFRSTVQNNLQDVSNDIVDLGNHTQKDASLSLRKFQFLSHRDNTPSEGKFFALTVGGTTSVTSILDENNLASDSATALATQQSIKAYVDAATSGSTITSVGALNSGSITSGFDSIDVGDSSISGGTITAGTAFVPDAADGASLGTASLEFSDLYLADGAVIQFGHDQDVSLTHVHDSGLLLSGTRQLQFFDASQRIAAPSGTVISIAATDEIDLISDLIDIDAAINVSGAAALATSLSIAGDGATVTGIKDEDNLVSDSDTKLATQASIKAYVDNATTNITASTGLERVSNDIRAKVSGAGNLVDAMASGTPVLADYFIFEDNDDNTVKEGTLADLPFVTAITAGAGLAKSGTLAPTLSVNAADGVRVTGDNVQLNVGGLSNAAPVAADSLVYYDDSAADHKRTLVSALPLNLMDNSTSGFISSVSAGAGIAVSGETINVKYIAQTGGAAGNLIDGAADSGDIAASDLILYRRDSDGVVRKDTVNALPFTNNNGTVTSVATGAGLTGGTITATGTISMNLLGLQTLSNPGANRVPFYRHAGTTFDWLLFDTGDFEYSDSTTLSIKSGAVGLTDTGAGLEASPASTVRVKYATQGSGNGNLIDGAASGTAVGADLLLFQDASDSNIVKKDSIANILDIAGGDITAVTAGAGLTGGGTSGAVTLNAIGTSNRITVNTNDIDIASSYVGQSSITTLGTITTGVWNGTAIANANLANSAVSFGGVSVALGAEDATPAFNLSDATAYTGDSSLVTSGALNSGSITSGFGPIDVGGSNIDGATITADTAFVGTLSTAAQGNITSVGTLTSLTTSGDITMGATDKLYLDGGSDTYIHESSGNTIRFFVGGVSHFQIQGDGVMIPSGHNLYLDNGGDTYITEGSSNVMRFYAGNAKQFEVSGTNMTVVGALSKGSGSFKIDHPLPEKTDTHHLVHSFVEGPRADLIYRGTATLVNGSALVDLDEAATMTSGTWDLLCRDPQVFAQNETGWAAVRGSVSSSTLTLTAQDSSAEDVVSWLVVAERKDQHMIETGWTNEQGKVIVEPEKEE